MKLSEYVAEHGDVMFALAGGTGPARIYIYGADAGRGIYTDRGWEAFPAAAERALRLGFTQIVHNTYPDGRTLHTDRIPLERETTA